MPKHSSNSSHHKQHSKPLKPIKNVEKNVIVEKPKGPVTPKIVEPKRSITELLALPIRALPPKSSFGNTIIIPATKVKPGSWKRTEKQISNNNNSNNTTIVSKKSKRRRSPQWLKFPNTPEDTEDESPPTFVTPVGSASVCRPGTLYSDVVFGAGSSPLVNIKPPTPPPTPTPTPTPTPKPKPTPHRIPNIAHNKITNTLFKRTDSLPFPNDFLPRKPGPANYELFPSLDAFSCKPLPTCSSPCPSTEKSKMKIKRKKNFAKTVDTKVNGDADKVDEVVEASAVVPEHKPLVVVHAGEDVDVVILSEMDGVPNADNGMDNITYGSYLEKHFRYFNGTFQCVKPRITTSKLFTVDIPKWNFLQPDASIDAYPKFLCQFEDEHYLKAEKMALLGLKLALGNNNCHQCKFTI